MIKKHSHIFYFVDFLFTSFLFVSPCFNDSIFSFVKKMIEKMINNDNTIGVFVLAFIWLIICVALSYYFLIWVEKTIKNLAYKLRRRFI